MQYRMEGGSLPAVIINLNPGETMISEAGGRTWSRGAVDSTVTTLGGAGKALGRMLMGESLFMNLYTAQEPAEIAFSSSFPGRIVARELGPGQSIICQKHAFLCATYGVELSMFFQKKLGTGLVGGEGFIMQKVTGPGLVFLEVDGYCQDYDLAPGERLVCDTGVLHGRADGQGREKHDIRRRGPVRYRNNRPRQGTPSDHDHRQAGAADNTLYTQ